MLIVSIVDRVVLDSWVVSQIWLNSDSNESSQSRVGRENQGYESSQSRITLMVISVRVESTGYLLLESKLSHWFFWRENVEILHLSVTLQSPTATFDPPPPGQQLYAKLSKIWCVVNQIWLNSDSNELSQSWVRLVNLDFELSQSWVRSSVPKLVGLDGKWHPMVDNFPLSVVIC